jgi:hypothetical protein
VDGIKTNMDVKDIEPARIRVVDIKVPFMSMVVFMVKATIAVIPAVIILVAIAGFSSGIVAGLFKTAATASQAMEPSPQVVFDRATSTARHEAARRCDKSGSESQANSCNMEVKECTAITGSQSEAIRCFNSVHP